MSKGKKKILRHVLDLLTLLEIVSNGRTPQILLVHVLNTPWKNYNYKVCQLYIDTFMLDNKNEIKKRKKKNTSMSCTARDD